MADKFTEVNDIKFSFKCDDIYAPQWITLPNPKTSRADIVAGLSAIENLAVDNRLLISKYTGDDVKEMNDVKIILKTETSLDWRS